MLSGRCGSLWVTHAGDASVLEAATNKPIVISVARAKLERESFVGGEVYLLESGSVCTCSVCKERKSAAKEAGCTC